MRKFEQGQVYFMVTYADLEMQYPDTVSYVYLGMNLSDVDEVDCWYFQSMSDCVVHGSALEKHREHVEVLGVLADQTNSLFDDEELFEAIRRSSSLRLRKAERPIYRGT